jgi:hypothetical protein
MNQKVVKIQVMWLAHNFHYSQTGKKIYKVNKPTHTRIEKKVQLFVEKNLVLLVAKAKVLKKLMCQSHKGIHPHILLLIIWYLQEI